MRKLTSFIAGMWIVICGALVPALAHNAPFSALALHTSATGIDAVFQASTKDFAHDLANTAPPALMNPAILDADKAQLVATLNTRLNVSADGNRLTAKLIGIEPVIERNDDKMTLRFDWDGPPKKLVVSGILFPYDPRHKTFVNIYQGDSLRRQGILDPAIPSLDFVMGSRQSIASVVGQFIYEGIHHIFIGPDHILFIVGLLLLGGSIKQLIKIVTAFTIAHSITLGLATFNILNPPARIIEPMIALSIVFVGVHSLTYKGKADPRLLFAFCFGFIHGFGFANALREMDLPRYALGWSLFSFNVGVEIGQMCIVLTCAPLLAYIKSRSKVISHRVVWVGSSLVIAAGAFWFVQRAFFAG